MADELLDESCPDCGTGLIKIEEGAESNHHDGDAITCPGCLNLIRVE
jgi:uncharacterized Zn finger protein (UPF0148 family)